MNVYIWKPLSLLDNNVPLVFCYLAGRIMDQLIEPGRIRLPLKKPDTCNVVSLACGRAHSVIAVEDEGGGSTFETLEFLVNSTELKRFLYLD